MSQADVLAVFGPGEKLTRAEIARRMAEERGVCWPTALNNISNARVSGKLKAAGTDPNFKGKRGTAWLYAVVE